MGEPKKFGRYEVRDTIGRGAMGVVYLAEDPVIGRQVAIKVVESHEGLEDHELEQLNARFEREFQSAGSLSHPNIVSVHDVGQEDGDSFIAMEFVQGESLSAVLAENRAFSFKEITDMAAQLGSGLDYAHEFDIVHRDIKPANILITRDGRPKITDFGVAKVATTTLTRTGTVVGTPAYMSPEQVTGHPVDGKADQFSLAVMLYQMLTGERPFSGENPTTIMYKIVHEEPPRPSALNVAVPEPVDSTLLRALSKNPEDRYPTCGDLADALRDALGAAPAAATMMMGGAGSEATVFDPSIAQSHHMPAKAPGKKFPLAALLGVVATIAIGAGAYWAWTQGLMGGPPAEPTPSPTEITLNLTVQAPDGLAIWVDGRDSGAVTPQAATISGREGASVIVELRLDGQVLAAQTLQLDADTRDLWAPDGIDELVAGIVAGGSGTPSGAGDPPPQPVEDDPAPPPVVEIFTITTNPAGVEVFFDGVSAGVSPARVEVDLSESHAIRLAAPGYNPESFPFDADTLTAEQRSSRELFFPLTRSEPPGSLTIDTRQNGYPVIVTVTPRGDTAGGERTSPRSVDHDIPLAAGTYRVVVSAPSIFWEGARTIAVRSGESQRLSFMPRAVSVRVLASPENATVRINGIAAGDPPFDQMLAVGEEYTFVFDWGGGVTKEQSERITQATQRILGQQRNTERVGRK